MMAYVKSRLEVLRCNENAGASEEEMSRQSNLCATAIVRHTACMTRSLGSAEAAEVMQLILETGMQPIDKAKVVETITSKLNNNDVGADAPAEASQKNSLQVCLHMENFLTARDWDTLPSSMQAVATRMILMGFHRLTEPSWSSVLALFNPDTSDTYAYLGTLRQFKYLVRSMVKKSVVTIPDDAKPMVLPMNPEQFKEEHPMWYASAFASEPPIPCRFSKEHLARLRSLSCCRSTRKAAHPSLRLKTQPRKLALTSQSAPSQALWDCVGGAYGGRVVVQQ